MPADSNWEVCSRTTFSNRIRNDLLVMMYLFFCAILFLLFFFPFLWHGEGALNLSPLTLIWGLQC